MTNAHSPDVPPQSDRVAALVAAEEKARLLFAEIEARGLVRAGRTERELSDDVKALALEMFGIRTFWHKRIVRSGINTLEPYRSNPPVLTLTEDDIVFFDFGPVFADWEADFGRTYVLGDDPHRRRLAADLPRIWDEAATHFRATSGITASEFHTHVLGLITDAGYGHGAAHAGHLIGEFPHERINGDELDCYIAPGNDTPMRRLDGEGKPCHWILEIHLTDPERNFGGFHEQLLLDA